MYEQEYTCPSTEKTETYTRVWNIRAITQFGGASGYAVPLDSLGGARPDLWEVDQQTYTQLFEKQQALQQKEAEQLRASAAAEEQAKEQAALDQLQLMAFQQKSLKRRRSSRSEAPDERQPGSGRT